MNRYSIVIQLLVWVLAVSQGFSDTLDSESEVNKRFCLDVVRVLSGIYSERGADHESYYESMFGFKQSVEDARLVMKPWSSDIQPVRKQGCDYLSSAFDYLQTAADIALEAEFPMNPKESALFNTKLNAGRKRLFQTTLIVLHPDTGLKLTEADRQEIADFTNRLFEKPLQEYRAKKEQGDDLCGLPGEIWGALVMSGEFSKSLPKEQQEPGDSSPSN